MEEIKTHADMEKIDRSTVVYIQGDVPIRLKFISAKDTEMIREKFPMPDAPIGDDGKENLKDPDFMREAGAAQEKRLNYVAYLRIGGMNFYPGLSPEEAINKMKGTYSETEIATFATSGLGQTPTMKAVAREEVAPLG